MADKINLAGYIDHTLLSPIATSDQIDVLCHEAIQYGFHSVCVHTRWISQAADILHNSSVKVCSVVSFPNGSDSTKIKAAQATEAVFSGADEIDMVADLSAIVTGDSKYLTSQINAVLRACKSMKPTVILKVIIESASLDLNQKIFAARLVEHCGADFIKTSTGLHRAGGATVEDIQLIKEIAPNCKIKAAGGIKSAESAIAMINAGADRIGTSSAVDIMKQYERSDG
jgi:deoxyribose-phosphate aldolase